MLQNGAALPPLSATDLDGNSVDLGAMPGVGDGDSMDRRVVLPRPLVTVLSSTVG